MTGKSDSNAAVDGGERLAGLARRGLVSSAAMPAYRKLIDDIYAPMLDKLGFDPAVSSYPDDGPDRQKMRVAVTEIVAGAGRDPAVRAKLLAAVDRYVAGDTKALDPQIYPAGDGCRGAGARGALRQGDGRQGDNEHQSRHAPGRVPRDRRVGRSRGGEMVLQRFQGPPADADRAGCLPPPASSIARRPATSPARI
ncbi:MAG: hypothetical protein WDN44_02440 [Sphingomonas sp.]